VRLLTRFFGIVTVGKRLAGESSKIDSWDIERLDESADGEVVRSEMTRETDTKVFY
jgi:hypothetical protein